MDRRLYEILKQQGQEIKTIKDWLAKRNKVLWTGSLQVGYYINIGNLPTITDYQSIIVVTDVCNIVCHYVESLKQFRGVGGFDNGTNQILTCRLTLQDVGLRFSSGSALSHVSDSTHGTKTNYIITKIIGLEPIVS